MTEEVSFTHFLFSMVFVGFYILSISTDIIGFRVPTQNLRNFLLSNVSHPVQIAPSPYVPPQQIPFVVTLTSSEGKISHLLIFHIISLFL
jgi:hypothetical protein